MITRLGSKWPLLSVNMFFGKRNPHDRIDAEHEKQPDPNETGFQRIRKIFKIEYVQFCVTIIISSITFD